MSVIKLVLLALLGLSNKHVICIDPEYTVDQRINAFLTASLNSLLTVIRADERPLKDDVTFWCSNRRNPNYTQTFFDDVQLKQKIDFYRPLVFLVHGWFDNKNRTWIKEMTDDFILFQNTNICVVDWNRLALQSYAISAKNTKKVGNQLGKFLKRVENEGMNLNKVVLVGHSFGSHICGYAGAAVGGRINAIYALDPAGPRFTKRELNPISERLDPSDAQFVQVIHTDRTYIGADYDLGHQDLYPNDGSSPQPGCFFPAGQTGLHPAQFLCSHFKAVEYFRASLNPANQFIAHQCDTQFDLFELGYCDNNAAEKLGIYAKRQVSGRFYLTTSEEFPFTLDLGRNKRQTTFEELQKLSDRYMTRNFGKGKTLNGMILKTLVGSYYI